MSAATIDDGDAARAAHTTADDRTLLRRLRWTRMRDVARGRIDGSLDLNHVFEASGLPASAHASVERVVRATRLARAERAAVARELVAHFRDGLDAGRDESELLGEFGDERAASRLIRRAKIRQRSLARRLPWIATKATAALLLVALGVYGVLALRVALAKPADPIDYIGRLRESLAAPDGERPAWPDVRDAWSDLRLVVADRSGIASTDTIELDHMIDESVLAVLRSTSGDEGEPAFVVPPDGVPSADVARADLEAFAPAIARLRDAVATSRLEPPVFSADTPIDPRDVAFFGPILDLPRDCPTSDGWEDSLVTTHLPWLSTLARVTRLLAADAAVALESGDVERGLADVRAMLGLGRLAGDAELFITALVDLAFADRAIVTIGDALARRSDAFGDEDLAAFDDVIASIRPDRLGARLAAEQDMLLDVVQRLYSDDGRGDGILLAERVATLQHRLRPDTADPALVARIVAPVAAITAPSRAEALADLRRWNADVACLLDRDPWTIDRTAFDAVSTERFDGRSRDVLAFDPRSMFGLQVGRAVFAVDRVLMRRDAVRTAIAAIRFERAEGRAPSSIGDLVPGWLGETPIDRFDGGALRLGTVDGALTVWSVGVDRVDDGGIEDAVDRPPGRTTRVPEWSPEPADDRDAGDVVLWRATP